MEVGDQHVRLLERAKVAAARDLWVPAMNNDDWCGRWALLEVTDPHDAANLIRKVLLSPEAARA